MTDITANIRPERILITGASGNVGQETIRELVKRSDSNRFEVMAGVRNPDTSVSRMKEQPNGFVTLDFTDISTFDQALSGISRVFLVRPPELSDIDAYFKPFVEAMKRAAVAQAVFLSLQGVESNPITPHHKIEKLIVEAGLAFTFLRPSFFMQNLSTTHRDEIRLHNEIFVPAGNGLTSFVDVRDVGAVAALALTGSEYLNKSYELTGSEALTYTQVADILTDVLGRKITYRNPSIIRFIWQKWHRERSPIGFALIMAALYTVSKLGKAAGVTNEVIQLLKRPPGSFHQFAVDYRSVWLP